MLCTRCCLPFACCSSSRSSHCFSHHCSLVMSIVFSNSLFSRRCFCLICALMLTFASFSYLLLQPYNVCEKMILIYKHSKTILDVSCTGFGILLKTHESS